MARILIIAYILISGYSGICQDKSRIAGKLNEQDKLKIIEIDNYIKFIDSFKNVKTAMREYEEHGHSTSYYLDSANPQLIKLESTNISSGEITYSVSYYRDNKLIYLKSPTNVNSKSVKPLPMLCYYYADGKLIYTDLKISDKITFISYARYDGPLGMGRNFSIAIISDSVLLRYIDTITNQQKFITAKISPEIWNNLIHSVKITDFEKVKSGEPHSINAKPNIAIIIRTENYSYCLVNGESDSVNYKKIMRLLNALKSELNKLLPPGYKE